MDNKQSYETPSMMVVSIEIEDAVLGSSTRGDFQDMTIQQGAID